MMNFGFDFEGKDAFDSYRRLYALTGDAGIDKFAPVDCVLNSWRKNKYQMYELLGKQMIIQKPIVLEKSHHELDCELNNLIDNHWGNLRTFFHTLDTGLMTHRENICKTMNAKDQIQEIDNYRFFINGIKNILFYSSELLNNAMPYDAEYFWFDNRTGETHKLKYSMGQKPMKVLGKIAKIIGHESIIEQFRLAHSQCLNQKRITGTLNLSIHPLDFATASDNANGWSSCMSWIEEGCYRLGTTEMMTSPMVICAYLSSNNTNMDWRYDRQDYEWPSKKWRAWVIVTPNLIIMNRQYPYDNENVATEVMKWVKELAETNLHYTYEDSLKKYFEDDDEWRRLSFRTNYMYNDIHDDHLIYVAPNYDKDDTINYSGPAVCMVCGDEIEFDGNSDEASTLACEYCRAIAICADCGNPITYYDEVYIDEETGEEYCYDCWVNTHIRCAYDGHWVKNEDAKVVTIKFDKRKVFKYLKTAKREDIGGSYTLVRAHSTFNYFTNSYILDKTKILDEISFTVCPECFEKMVLKPNTNIIDVSATINTNKKRINDLIYNSIDPRIYGFYHVINTTPADLFSTMCA